MNVRPFAIDSWVRDEGSPVPLGARWVPELQAYNFALYSKAATAVTLLLYRADDVSRPARTVSLQPPRNKTMRVWHVLVPASQAAGAKYYAYAVDGPRDPLHGGRFDPDKVLLDPYARSVYFPRAFSRAAATQPGSNAGKGPVAHLPSIEANAERRNLMRPTRHTHDLVIYEMHVRNFTGHPSSLVPEELRGTYAGVARAIPHLRDLGVTAVELMPIQQYDPLEGSRWGYMTLGFFAPHHEYAQRADGEAAVAEFRDMVRALHDADIEVLLDVVYNHTTEGSAAGPTYSFRGLDNSTYYLLDRGDLSRYTNLSGCGNDMRTAHPATRRLVVDSLRYWATEMGVDGFRFDLASIFMRNDNGTLAVQHPPILAEISSDPVLANLRLVAEPWQATPGGYVLGREFPGRTWWQWNDRFRNDVRSFVKGGEGLVPALMQRLAGSPDVFPGDPPNAYRPRQSVNYVDSHDEYNMYDTVSYTDEGQRSWDCGWRGDNGVPAVVMALRRRQVKNFCALLMLSNGTPMFVAGDEFLHSQRGYLNPYDLDNDTVWIDWRRREANRDVFRFFREMIAFRKAHPSIGRSVFWGDDVRWHGVGPDHDISQAAHSFAFHLRGRDVRDADLYVMINAYWRDIQFAINDGRAGEWSRVVDTGRDSPDDILPPGSEEVVRSTNYVVGARSIVVLMRPFV